MRCACASGLSAAWDGEFGPLGLRCPAVAAGLGLAAEVAALSCVRLAVTTARLAGLRPDFLNAVLTADFLAFGFTIKTFDCDLADY